MFICQAAPTFAFLVITYMVGLTMPWIKYRWHWIHKRFHDQIADADKEAGFTWNS